MSLILSVDDACAEDVRIAELCTKYYVDCVFYWPAEWHALAEQKGYKPLSYADAYDIAKNFEIGSHSITHKLLTKLSIEEAHYEIAASRLMLEKMFDTKITKFAPPRGYTNKELTNFTLTNYSTQRLTVGDDLVHIHPASGANGGKNWLECFDDNTREIWCHSWELSKYNLWDELEEVLKNERR